MTVRPRRGAICLALAFGLLVHGAAVAQTPASSPSAYDGDWQGSLHAGGRDLRLELHVRTDAGETKAVLDSLDQGATIPASAVKIEDGELGILFLAVGGELKAKLSPDGAALAGTWTQGVILPLTLTRKTAAAK